MHKRPERKPQTVEDCEVVGEARSSGRVFDVPLRRTESTDDEESNADGDVREHDAQPDVVVQRIHEREHAWFLFLGFLDHDADAEVHERFAEVDHALSQ